MVGSLCQCRQHIAMRLSSPNEISLTMPVLRRMGLALLGMTVLDTAKPLLNGVVQRQSCCMSPIVVVAASTMYFLHQFLIWYCTNWCTFLHQVLGIFLAFGCGSKLKSRGSPGLGPCWVPFFEPPPFEPGEVVGGGEPSAPDPGLREVLPGEMPRGAGEGTACIRTRSL